MKYIFMNYYFAIAEFPKVRSLCILALLPNYGISHMTSLHSTEEFVVCLWSAELDQSRHS